MALFEPLVHPGPWLENPRGFPVLRANGLLQPGCAMLLAPTAKCPGPHAYTHIVFLQDLSHPAAGVSNLSPLHTFLFFECPASVWGRQ